MITPIAWTASAAPAKIDIRSTMAFIIVLLFLVFRRSMAYLGIPPLYGGEITIILFAIMFFRGNALSAFVRNPIGGLAAVYMLLPLPFLAADMLRGYHIDIDETGRFTALFYYGVFIYFGYAAVASKRQLDLWIQLLYWGILFSTCHYLLSHALPLSSISSVINGISLFGQNDSAYIYYPFGLCYCVLFCQKLSPTRLVILVSVTMLAYIIHFERGALLGMLGCITVLILYSYDCKKALSGKTVGLSAAALLVLAVGFYLIVQFMPASEIAEKIGVQGQLARSIFMSDTELQGKTGTRDHRLQMWHDVYSETVRSDPFFGQGFHSILVDVKFWHPHNSFVSIFGRTGIFGLMLGLSIYILMPIIMAVKLHAVTCPDMRRIMLLLICFVPAFLSGALFGPTLESPYSSLVCNFMYGVMLRVSSLPMRDPILCNSRIAHGRAQRILTVS